MKNLLYLFASLSPFLLFAGIIVMGVAVKAIPTNLRVLGIGASLAVFALLTFPRPGHPMFDVLQTLQTRLTGIEPEPTTKTVPEAEAKALAALDQLVDVNVAAADFEMTPQEYHAGWSLLNPIVGPSDGATSWIGGLPEMPEDYDWPQADGVAAMFLAQIAMSDLPDDIWGGLGPKTGWLVFFVSPQTDITVLHIDRKGPPRPYPNAKVLVDYQDYDARYTMQALDRTPSQALPLKFAVSVAPTDRNPPYVMQHQEERSRVFAAMREVDLNDPRLAGLEKGAEPNHGILTRTMLEAYVKDTSVLPSDLEQPFQDVWAHFAKVGGGAIGGPVNGDFFYDAPQNPARLLQLSTSDLLGWSFGDVASLGVFINPGDLRARRWHKAWYSIQN